MLVVIQDNMQIHTNAFNMIFGGGKVRLLIDEKSAKDNLLAATQDSPMGTQDRLRYMEPFKNTSLLVSETSNLRMNNNNVYIKLEKISAEQEKDTFSALEYGLWKISLLEKEHYRRKPKRVSWANILQKN